MAMRDWPAIMTEARKVGLQLRNRDVNVAEARRAMDYYVDHGYDEQRMASFLRLLPNSAALRSNRTMGDLRHVRDIWLNWRTDLSGQDKALAWAWAIRLAQVEEGGR